MFITNNQDSFQLWGKGNLVKHQKVSNYYDQDCLKNFRLYFMSLIRSPIFENSHFPAEVFFIFLNTRPRSNFKGFQYEIWISVKRSEKWLSNKTNFIISLQISSSNFRLKLC